MPLNRHSQRCLIFVAIKSAILLYIIAAYLRPGYIGVMILLLLLYCLMPKQRPMLKGFISTCNGLLLILIGINIFYWVYEFFMAWYGQNNYEHWAFAAVSPRIDTLAIFLSLDCILVVLLLFKKWRPTIWMSIIACVCSSGFVYAFIINRLYQFFFRDYLPSFWSFNQVSLFQQWVDRLLPPMVFALMALALYYLQHRYRKYMQVKKATPGQTH